MSARALTLGLLCLWPLGGAAAQEKASPAYAVLLEQVKKSDPKADFFKLRMAFTETAAYKPYGPDT
jgi:hypothetical protein